MCPEALGVPKWFDRLSRLAAGCFLILIAFGDPNTAGMQPSHGAIPATFATGLWLDVNGG